MSTVWLTRAEVAARLKISPRTLANWGSQHKGPEFVRFGPRGSMVRYPEHAVIAWEKTQQTITATAA